MVVSATAHRAGIAVRWRSPSEVGIVAYNVWRDGRPVNAAPIRSRGVIGPAVYTWNDRRAPKHGTFRYAVEAVRLDGTRAIVGSVSMRR